MSHDWADKIARQLLGQGIMQTGVCLILGAADTGKTTLAAALGKQLAQNRPVGIIDVAIGVINNWQDDKDIAVIRGAPQLDILQIRCLVIGDATVDMPGGPGE